MKKILILFTVCALTFAVGCGTSETTTANTDAKSEPAVSTEAPSPAASTEEVVPAVSWKLSDTGDLKPAITASSENSVTITFTGDSSDSIDQLLASTMTVDGTSYSISDGEDGFEGFPLTITHNGEEVKPYYLASTELLNGGTATYTITGDFTEFSMNYDEVMITSGNKRFDYKALKLTITKQ